MHMILAPPTPRIFRPPLASVSPEAAAMIRAGLRRARHRSPRTRRPLPGRCPVHPWRLANPLFRNGSPWFRGGAPAFDGGHCCNCGWSRPGPDDGHLLLSCSDAADGVDVLVVISGVQMCGCVTSPLGSPSWNATASGLNAAHAITLHSSGFDLVGTKTLTVTGADYDNGGCTGTSHAYSAAQLEIFLSGGGGASSHVACRVNAGGVLSPLFCYFALACDPDTNTLFTDDTAGVGGANGLGGNQTWCTGDCTNPANGLGNQVGDVCAGQHGTCSIEVP
jgi:hypothetical protein